jgi:hypothetical protein
LNEELRGVKDWQKVQEKVVEYIKTHLASSNASKSILSKVSHITCGFDDGELEKINK